MSSSPKAVGVSFDDAHMWVALSDGRRLGVPSPWFSRLERATPAERAQVRISSGGLHWEVLDEDISIAGLLAVRRDDTQPQRRDRAA